jgi:hypothetical protein
MPIRPRSGKLWEAYAHDVFLDNLRLGYANDSAHINMCVAQHRDLLFDHRLKRFHAIIQLSQFLARLFLLRQQLPSLQVK